jgi:hypothetical protein
MSEATDTPLRRQTVLRMLGLAAVGTGRCPECQQRAEIFTRRRGTPGQAKERCLDCWKAER